MHIHDLTRKQNQTQKLKNQIYGYHRGKKWTRDKLGGKAKQIQTITYKAHNPKKKKSNIYQGRYTQHSVPTYTGKESEHAELNTHV